MALDAALEEAVRQAVKEQGQKPALAERMIAWLEALGEGDLAIEDQDGFYSRLMSGVALEESPVED